MNTQSEINIDTVAEELISSENIARLYTHSYTIHQYIAVYFFSEKTLYCTR